MKELLNLYVTFLKIGAFMFGGGYSMLPLLNRELVDKKQWVTEEELLDYFALSQCLPGVIAVSTATFIGQKRRGVLGSAFATLGANTIPILLIILIAAVLQNFWELPAVVHAFNGVRAAVCALIGAAVIRMFRASVKSWLGVALCLFGFAVVALFGQSPIIVLVTAAVIGLVVGRVRA